MQNLIFFLEPNDEAFHIPVKIGNLLMNRLAIDEDAAFEVGKVLELHKSSNKMKAKCHPYLITTKEREMKEIVDEDVIDSALLYASTTCSNSMITHFIYAGDYYKYDEDEDHHKKIKDFILTKMKKYGLKSAMLTMVSMSRSFVITKEHMKNCYKGTLSFQGNYATSVNDDIDCFFTELQSYAAKDGDTFREVKWTFFIPKLTPTELQLLKSRNIDFLRSFAEYHYGKTLFGGSDPDVSKNEMSKSKSKSKFVLCGCWRYTTSINIDSNLEDPKVKYYFSEVQGIHKSRFDTMNRKRFIGLCRDKNGFRPFDKS